MFLILNRVSLYMDLNTEETKLAPFTGSPTTSYAVSARPYVSCEGNKNAPGKPRFTSFAVE